MSSNNYKVYKHENLLNGKVYIGITSQDCKKRWQNGIGYKGTHFDNAIIKYGWNCFSHEVVAAGLSKDEACALEVQLISKYQSTNPERGYNVSAGGTAMYCKPLFGADNYRSAAVRRIDPKTGEEVCYDTVKSAAIEMGVNHQGISKACRGICKTYKGYVWEYADISFEKPQKCARGKYPHTKTMKRVQMIDVDGTVHVFDSIKDAGAYIGKPGSTISRYLSGLRTDASGRGWSLCL